MGLINFDFALPKRKIETTGNKNVNKFSLKSHWKELFQNVYRFLKNFKKLTIGHQNNKFSNDFLFDDSYLYFISRK